MGLSERPARAGQGTEQQVRAIAHDLNNLLGVILNYAELVADSLPEDSPARRDLAEIRRATQDGAELTRQLLSVSRDGD